MIYTFNLNNYFFFSALGLWLKPQPVRERAGTGRVRDGESAGRGERGPGRVPGGEREGRREREEGHSGIPIEFRGDSDIFLEVFSEEGLGGEIEVVAYLLHCEVGRLEEDLGLEDEEAFDP